MSLKLSSPRILIVRLSAIGDVVHGLPVLNALREKFPKAFIGWVVEGRTADVLCGHPALDQVIQVPRKWLKSPSATWRLRKELRSLKFDIAIDLQCLTKSAIAARLSGAKRRIGFGGPDGREFSRWLHNEFVTPTAAHVIDKNLQLLQALGIERPEVKFELPEAEKDAATADKIVTDLFANLASQSGPSRPFAIINPGAGWPSKRWPLDHFAEVARHLGHQHQLSSLVVWAGSEERSWAEHIVAGSMGQAHLAPNTTLTELVALSRRATLFVGSDTGPLHLAAAVGTPCVGLFGPMPRERNGPYGSQHIALQEVWLTGSSRERRTADTSSMEAIQVPQVNTACDTILQRGILASDIRRSA